MTTARTRRTRHDGWTRARRAAFLAALARTGNVSAAADAVGMTPQTAYRLRRRDPGFAQAWDLSAVRRMEAFVDLARARIERGTVETQFRDARLVGYRIAPDDRLLTAMLKGGARPSRKRIAAEFAIVPLHKVTNADEKPRFP